MRTLIGSLLLLGWSGELVAQEIKPICPDRGAIQPCTVEPGRLQAEVALVDWFQDSENTLVVMDTTIRWGVGDESEIQLGVSPWIRKNTRASRGDLRVTYRNRVVDGPVSLAIQPSIILPTGSKSVTQGRAAPGLALGMTWDISPQTQLYVSPYGLLGRKTIAGGFIGVNQSIRGRLGGALELFGQHQRGETQASLDYTLTYTISDDLELDTSANLGLTRRTPALELVLGISRRF